ncbi:penicillin acylase family protein [Dasania sp. GY-MA-18]|uniref:Penicillin acylase family protein n=1 Tax=Dasania phycosphaerae TaxID=2950436 RepID=A0A9J6RJ88_9GAMM|nr:MULTISPECIES: penicillin acylase family protein [Dasania]MCR8921884.1 penicillin acylase family protein [Dasania sp. GY-MA-18]MCZ0864312.1 penicillin acylase family protein [Dasania phycosphaerae]MCZ0868040.1 penicillin acylase family protein [Dasania phycosphaerae]
MIKAIFNTQQWRLSAVVTATLAASLLSSGCIERATNSTQLVKQAQVEIVRDQYGVPHIYAEDNYGVFFGYGYAVAQDRLFQMDMLRRSALGTVAEVLGEQYFEFDKFIRSSYDSRSVPAQIAKLSPRDKRILQGYADGINRHLQNIRKSPDTLTPIEYIEFDFEPTDWTIVDVAMLFTGPLAHRFSDGNTELDNLQFLQALESQHGKETAWKIFSASKWLYDSQSPTTVPTATTNSPEAIVNPPRPAYLSQLSEQAAGSKLSSYMPTKDGLPIISHGDSNSAIMDTFARRGTSGTPGFASASNLWAVNGPRSKGAKGSLINGPQFGWTSPSYVYGIALHGGDFDVTGNTLLFSPNLLFAHNNHIGWGSTAGFGDQVDIFEEQLNPKNPEQYMHKGHYRPFESWQETINIKGQQARTITVRRSVHGMVETIKPEQNIAYSRARTWDGKEIDTLLAWIELATVKDINKVNAVLDRIATNINFYVIDKNGNLLYRHGGHYPRRNPLHDTRFPVPGTGELDWQGIRSGSESPSVLNPKTNYLVNWNNRPARGWASPDMWWLTWGRGDRANILIDEITAVEALTPEQSWNINQRASYADVNREYLLPYLQAALANQTLSKLESQAYAALMNWDGYWWDKNEDGKFDGAAPLIFESWLSQLLQATLKDDVGEEFFKRFSATGHPTSESTGSINLQPGTKALIRNLDELRSGTAPIYDFFNGVASAEVLQQAFATSVAQLAEQLGEDITLWHALPAAMVYHNKNYRGIPQALDDAQYQSEVIQNRGSENNLFIAKGTHIEAWDVFGPGQSAFISPQGERSPHHSDQLELFASFGKKKMPFLRKDIVNPQLETLMIGSKK